MPRVAWFHPRPSTPSPAADDTAALAAALSARGVLVDGFDEAHAHDFVWRHARQPYDLCVYDLADTDAHAFVWPYLVHYPGLLRLRSPAAGHSRAPALIRTFRRRELAAEVAFAGPELLKAAVLGSRLVAVSDEQLAGRLHREYPSAPIRLVPLGIGQTAAPRTPSFPDDPLRIETTPGTPIEMVERAAARAQAAGARLELRADGAGAPGADVLLALEWPPYPGEPPLSALAGMSRHQAVVVLETVGTARWPALDPQTWETRELTGRSAPLAVSIDPRDEEHSLVLVMRRFAADRALVDRLAAGAHAWWRDHATLAHAASGWERAIDDAMRLAPPPRPPGWPDHLDRDGTGDVRRVAEELGLDVDVLRAR